MKKKIYILIAVSLQGIAFAQAPSISYTTPQTYSKGTPIPPLIPTNTGGEITYGKVTTFAGSGSLGSTDGVGTAASFSSPHGVAVDASGNLYVTDSYSPKIRKISPSGTVSSFAGNGSASAVNGTGATASFNSPYGIVVDGQGNVYVSDKGNNKIRKITPEAEVTTFAGSGTAGSADGNGMFASFSGPTGLAIDNQGNLYVADAGNNKIRMISPAGVVTTLAGSGNVGSTDGNGTSASFNYPRGLAVDNQGNVYVADYQNYKVRKISPSGTVITLAGSGSAGSADTIGTAASFGPVYGIAVDASGNVYVGQGNDCCNNKIRMITPAGAVSTLAGSDGAGSTDGKGTAASFIFPYGVAVDASGIVYVAEYSNKIRKINAAGGYKISPALPAGLTMDPSTGTINGTPTTATPKTTYTITATNAIGTSTSTLDITVNAALGIEDVSFKNMVVYPNPTTGDVNINNVMIEKINVYNNAGQLVKTVTNQEAVNTTTVQLNNLPTGIYYMNIETENACIVKQVIKK